MTRPSVDQVAQATSVHAACAIALGALLALGASRAQSNAPLREGLDHVAAGRWAEAAAALGAAVVANPTRSEAWAELGVCNLRLGHYGEARAAYEQAIGLGYDVPASTYQIACAWAREGDVEQGLVWLGEALERGFNEEETLREDHDIDALRGDPRFAELTGLFPPDDHARDERWRWDLRFLRQRIEQCHIDPFRVIPREELERELEALASSVPRLENPEVLLELMRIVARVGDGHTFVRVQDLSEAVVDGSGATEAEQLAGLEPLVLPLSFYWFDEGLFVDAAAEDAAQARGCKVLRIGRASAEQALELAVPLCSVDNAMGVRLQAPDLLETSTLLQALGLIEWPDRVPLELETAAGERRSLEIEARPLARRGELVPAWSDAPGERPISFSPREDNWFEILPEERLLYARYNGVHDMPGLPIRDYFAGLFAALDESRSEYLVLDLRGNGGGNLYNNRTLIQELVRRPRFDTRGSLFVIVGRRTFSAAMIGVAQIDKYCAPIFVGEPTGSSPNFVGETNFVRLPCSGIRVSLSNKRWQGTYAEDTRTWIAPELYAPPTAAAFLAGRDPALEAIRAWIAEHGEPR